MIYLNNASTSYPKPAAVTKALQCYLACAPISPGRDFSSEYSGVVEECKYAVAQLLGLSCHDDIYFYNNATQALNQAIFGLDWHSGDEIVTTVTEHNSVLRPLHFLQKKYGVKLSFAPCDEFGIVNTEALLNQVTAKTRLVVVNHVSNVTGAIQNIYNIGKRLAEHKALFLVDAAQSLGVYPVNIKQCYIDMLAFTGHKFLFSMQGIGGLYISPAVTLTPLIHGGTGVMSEQVLQPTIRPFMYEAGTPNIPGIVSLNAGIKNISNDLHAILSQKAQALKTGLKDIHNIVFQSAPNSTLLSFTSPNIDIEDFDCLLKDGFNIQARTGLHCAPFIHSYLNTPKGTVRLSPSIYTSDDDITYTCKAIKKIVKTLAPSYENS